MRERLPLKGWPQPADSGFDFGKFWHPTELSGVC
jgi:hypothetical protein